MNIEKMTSELAELKKIMHSNKYLFEVDTKDMVFGFEKTLKKRTSCLAKSINLQVKLTKDCGRFLSDTVRIVAVRYYKNGELLKVIIASPIN